MIHKRLQFKVILEFSKCEMSLVTTIKQKIIHVSTEIKKH